MCLLLLTCKYGCLWQPIFLPFGFGIFSKWQIFGMTVIWNIQLNWFDLAGHQFYIDEADVNKYLTSVVDSTGLNAFHCQICGKTAPNKSNMKKHMLVIHAKPANIPCPHCHKTFPNKYYLRYHIKCCNRNPELMAKKYQLKSADHFNLWD